MLSIPTMLPGSTPEYQIATQRYEIMFRDCSAIGLYQVWQHGAPVLMLRALRWGDVLVVFDLRDVAPVLDEDLRKLPARDQVGAVFYTLRGKYKTAEEFIAAVVAKPKRILTAPRVPTDQLELEAA